MNLEEGYYWTFKQGSVGKVLSGNLQDGNGPFEITGAVTVRAIRGGQDAVWDAVACTPSADQVNNPGDFSLTLDGTTAGIPTGAYNLEFTHTDGGNLSIWPDDEARNYGVLVVTRPL